MKKIFLVSSFMFLFATQACAYTSLNGYSINIGNQNNAKWVTVSFVNTGSNSPDPVFFGYTSANYSGYYIGTIDGNDSGSDSTFAILLNHYLYGTDNDTTTDYNISSSDDLSPAVTLTYDNSSNSSGTWNITPPTANVSFYTVKSSNQYALYFLAQPTTFGTWSTGNLTAGNSANPPSISHLSVATSPVPVPSTALLLGSSLLGLVGFASRKRS